jgi:hypothetical protein
MNEWKALNGRITLFPTVPVPAPLPSAFELYRRVWGGDPDNYQKQANALLPTVAQGTRNGIAVQLVSQPARIDFSLSPPPAPGAITPSIDLIENTSQFHAELTRIIDVLAKGAISNPVLRVALGVQFVSLKTDVIETNKTLMAVMPVPYRVKLTDEQDFVFQINRPQVSSRVESIRMNFVTTWRAQRLQVVNFTILAAGMPVSASKDTSLAQPHPEVKEFIAASVSFDNNNVPAGPLTSSQQSELLLEGIARVETGQREIGLNIEEF